MSAIRVYADTSVFGGVADTEFAAHSRLFFAAVREGKYVLLLSVEVYRELDGAPDAVREAWLSLPTGTAEEVPLTQEVEDLARAYIEAGILGGASEADARHVAAAVVAEADVIVSWNFRHIVNRRRIQMYNAINVLRGYRPIEIFSPREMEPSDEEAF